MTSIFWLVWASWTIRFWLELRLCGERMLLLTRIRFTKLGRQGHRLDVLSRRSTRSTWSSIKTWKMIKWWTLARECRSSIASTQGITSTIYHWLTSSKSGTLTRRANASWKPYFLARMGQHCQLLSRMSTRRGSKDFASRKSSGKTTTIAKSDERSTKSHHCKGKATIYCKISTTLIFTKGLFTIFLSYISPILYYSLYFIIYL